MSSCIGCQKKTSIGHNGLCLNCNDKRETCQKCYRLRILSPRKWCYSCISFYGSRNLKEKDLVASLPQGICSKCDKISLFGLTGICLQCERDKILESRIIK